MKKKKREEFDFIDDYFEEEYDDSLFNVDVGTDLSNVRYEDFNKAQEVEEDDDDDEVETVKTETTKKTVKTTTTKKSSKSFDDRIIENEGVMDILTFFWTWFRRIGIAIAVILMAYYITQGMMADLFFYILMLVVAFFFGFGFMALINQFTSNR
ncbi:MAG: hypothetical protein J6X28_05995 [Bacilli bacterium]|nr:hypothetical protein [Bacilli bacterium]